MVCCPGESYELVSPNRIFSVSFKILNFRFIGVIFYEMYMLSSGYPGTLKHINTAKLVEDGIWSK